MGTRNLTMVKLDGKRKVAQYCQWDGYPTGQGKTVFEFITNKMDLRTFKSKVSKLKKATGKQVDKLWEECGAVGGMGNMEVSDKFKNNYPEFHRDTGAKILEMIQDGKVESVYLDTAFLKDGLFCEWAYELDLDKKVLKVYQSKKTGKDTWKAKLVRTIPFNKVKAEFGQILSDYEAFMKDPDSDGFEL